jgi:hypothetical protein
MFPVVKANPPNRWKRYGPELDDDAVKRLLDAELRKAFGTAEHHVGEMKVKCVFKGVTYELLSDADFLRAASNLPSFPKLHREFDAVRLARPTGGKAP